MVRTTKIFAVLLSLTLLFSTVGCSYTSPNKVIRYGTYGGTIGATPGILIMGAGLGSGSDAGLWFLVGGLFAASGYVSGAVVGGIIGIVAGPEQEPDPAFNNDAQNTSNQIDEDSPTIDDETQEPPEDRWNKSPFDN